MVTIYDIAKYSGYSISTVSKALNNYKDVNEETRRRILDAAEELGYIPNSNAKSLSTKKTMTIGVVFEEKTGLGITHPFFSKVLNEFKKCVEEKGYDLLFMSDQLGKNPKLSYYEHCLLKGVDGVIILCSDITTENIKRLFDSDIPSVIIDNDTSKTNCVYTDNYKYLFLATKYLIEKGHTRIAHIAGSIASFVGKERLRGYKDALKHHGIAVRDDYILRGHNYSIIQGYNRGLDIIKMEDKPTAVIAASDTLAFGMMKALEEHGYKVPEDISVIGYDDSEIALYTQPPLTTIQQNTERIAKEAAKLLVAQMQKPTKTYQKKVIDAKLIERQTVRSFL